MASRHTSAASSASPLASHEAVKAVVIGSNPDSKWQVGACMRHTQGVIAKWALQFARFGAVRMHMCVLFEFMDESQTL